MSVEVLIEDRGLAPYFSSFAWMIRLGTGSGKTFGLRGSEVDARAEAAAALRAIIESANAELAKLA